MLENPSWGFIHELEPKEEEKGKMSLNPDYSTNAEHQWTNKNAEVHYSTNGYTNRLMKKQKVSEGSTTRLESMTNRLMLQLNDKEDLQPANQI